MQKSIVDGVDEPEQIEEGQSDQTVLTEEETIAGGEEETGQVGKVGVLSELVARIGPKSGSIASVGGLETLLGVTLRDFWMRTCLLAQESTKKRLRVG